jgi:transposase-like protein
LAEALGSDATLSKSTVSRICEAIKTEFDVWKKRDLSNVALEYLFLDGSHFRYHDGARAEPVLAAWGMTTEGRPVLVGLEPGASESTDAWRASSTAWPTGACGRRCWSSPTAPLVSSAPWS